MMHNLKNLGGIALAAVLVLSGCDAPVQPPAEPAEDETEPAVQSVTEFAARGLDLPKRRTPEQVTTPLMSASASASNGLTFFFDRATFDAAFPGLPLEDFETGNVSAGGVVGCPSPLDEFNNDACFSTGDIEPGIRFSSSTPRAFDGIALIGTGAFSAPSKYIVANFFVDDLEIDFTAGDVRAVGMDLKELSSAPNCRVDINGTSGLLGSITRPCTAVGSDFLGVQSTELITQIVISSGWPAAPGAQAQGVDNIAFGPGIIAVDVDIKPGGDLNSINLTSKGRLPVAILTTDDFDAADVDPSTVTLGNDDGDDTGVATRKNGTLFANLEDVDGDGDLDLILHFDTQALVGNGDLDANTTELTLNGETTGGQAIQGSDSVNIVP